MILPDMAQVGTKWHALRGSASLITIAINDLRPDPVSAGTLLGIHSHPTANFLIVTINTDPQNDPKPAPAGVAILLAVDLGELRSVEKRVQVSINILLGGDRRGITPRSTCTVCLSCFTALG
jgi:hypothetical protein